MIESIREHRDKTAKTLQECVERMAQKTDAELLAFMREQNASLIEWLEYENRWLAVLAGEKVEPKQVTAHAMLQASFGGGL